MLYVQSICDTIINKLIDENNEIMTDQMHILSTIKSYYENCILHIFLQVLFQYYE
jgi:hypothetical protein